ncbi:MAG: DUF4031 domain-containing protein [Kordiimonadaceae bacterium]|nr:DUF4031 domain-containing protein [Kordiimonadaceae bacterium]
MSVYVDTMKASFRGMVMCHMLADTHQELLEMADKIGMEHKWIQHAGSEKEHFDIPENKRTLALLFGAIEISRRDLVRLIRAKRARAATVLAVQKTG